MLLEWQFNEQFLTASYWCAEGKGLQTSHQCLIHIWAQYSLMWKCICDLSASSLRQREQNGLKHLHHTFINDAIWSGSNQMRKPVQNICSHWPITPLKTDWINRLRRETYWTCLFEVWLHKTQRRSNKTDDSQRHCQPFLFGCGSTLRLPFTDCPLVPKQPNNTASVF